jgi:hypothetical protein
MLSVCRNEKKLARLSKNGLNKMGRGQNPGPFFYEVRRLLNLSSSAEGPKHEEQ